MAVSNPPVEKNDRDLIDIHTVRRLFNNVERVAHSNFLRREISSRMLERLSLIKVAPQIILDAGCGEGSDSEIILNRYPSAKLVGVDLSLPMLLSALTKPRIAERLVNKFLPNWKRFSQASPFTRVCSDFSNLPLAKSSADIVWSNLALHWHPKIEQVLDEWQRVLRVDGLLMFSCFGPDTFKELREAFDDGASRVMRFTDMHDLGDMLIQSGFSTPVMDMEKITVTYNDAGKLMSDVRSFGGNPLSSKSFGLMGKNAWDKVVLALESHRRSDGKIPLTFEILYGHAFKPMPRQTGKGETIIQLHPSRTLLK